MALLVAAGCGAMGPIASKVLQEIRKAKRGQVIDLRAVRELKGLASNAPDLRGIPVHHRDWIVAFRPLALFTNVLLGAHALRKAAEQLRAAVLEKDVVLVGDLHEEMTFFGLC